MRVQILRYHQLHGSNISQPCGYSSIFQIYILQRSEIFQSCPSRSSDARRLATSVSSSGGVGCGAVHFRTYNWSEDSFENTYERDQWHGRLSGWWFQLPVKNTKVNWDDIPNIWENNPVMFQSPPTSIYIYILHTLSIYYLYITHRLPIY